MNQINVGPKKFLTFQDRVPWAQNMFVHVFVFDKISFAVSNLYCLEEGAIPLHYERNFQVGLRRIYGSQIL